MEDSESGFIACIFLDHGILKFASEHRLFPKAELNIDASLRRKIQFFTLRDAVFDFLPTTQPDILGHILLDLGVKLVRGVPPHIQKRFESLPTLATISGQVLRRLFKSEKSRECLKSAMTDGRMDWNLMLSILVPKEDAMMDDLDGCHILPIMDGTLGTMKIISTTQDTLRFLLVSDKEAEIFSFASQHFVKPCARKHLLLVEKKGRLNLQKLQLRDVLRILKSKPISAIPTEEEDKWLLNFWKFWDSNGGSANEAPNVDDFDEKLFRAVKDGRPQYVPSFQFSILPAIVEPSDATQRKLCQAFPELYIFDSKFIPAALSKKHSYLRQTAAFNKFIHSLKMLADWSKQTGIEDFIKSRINTFQLKVNLISVSRFLSSVASLMQTWTGTQGLGRLPHQYKRHFEYQSRKITEAHR